MAGFLDHFVDELDNQLRYLNLHAMTTFGGQNVETLGCAPTHLACAAVQTGSLSIISGSSMNFVPVTTTMGTSGKGPAASSWSSVSQKPAPVAQFLTIPFDKTRFG